MGKLIVRPAIEKRRGADEVVAGLVPTVADRTAGVEVQERRVHSLIALGVEVLRQFLEAGRVRARINEEFVDIDRKAPSPDPERGEKKVQPIRSTSCRPKTAGGGEDVDVRLFAQTPRPSVESCRQ